MPPATPPRLTRRSTQLACAGGAQRRWPNLVAVAVAVASRRLALAVGVLAAVPAAGLPAGLRVESKVEARVAGTQVSAVEAPGVAATDPQRLAADSLLESRLRAGGLLRWELGGVWLQALQLDLQADLFAAPVRYTAQDGSDDAAEAADRNLARLRADHLLGADRGATAEGSLLLRQLAVSAEGRFFHVSAGRQVSRWGLGLLAQSGDDEPFQFGLKRRGAVVDRAQVALLPAGLPGDGSLLAVAPLALVFAADRVVEDDLATRAAGDDARQLVAAMVLRYPQLKVGAYGVRRWQRDERALGLNVWVGDAFAAWHGKVMGLRASLATEWLMIRGDTNYFRTPSSPARLDVEQAGGLLRLRLEGRDFGVQLDGGYASGDDRPFDEAITNFKLARDMRVGIVLFGELWRRQSANIVHNLGDVRYTGQAPAGAERFASGGSATGALWHAQTLRARVGNLTLLGGFLVAQGTTKLVDPHRTGLAGGSPKGPRGGAASDELGVEFDAAAQLDQPLPAGLALRARIDFGVAFPGAAFAGADGSAAAAVGAAIGQLALRGSW